MMNYKLRIALLLLFIIGANKNIFAQEFLKFDYSEKPLNSTFSKVRVINNRQANSYYGFVQKGLNNRKEYINFDGNFNDSIAKFFINKSASSNQELIIILDDFNLSEKTAPHSETGRFKLSARFFKTSNSDKYIEIFSIDSAFEFNSMDVSKKLLKLPSIRFSEISKNIILSQPISENEFTFFGLQKIDSIEKMKIPIYAESKINKGVYRTFEQFKNNTADRATYQIDTTKSGTIIISEVYKTKKGKTKLNGLTTTDLYAFTYNNKLYKANSIGYFEMWKYGMDFYYDGQTSFTQSQDFQKGGFYFFAPGAGAIIALAATVAVSAIRTENHRKYNSDYFTFKINYKKGNSILYSMPK